MCSRADGGRRAQQRRQNFRAAAVADDFPFRQHNDFIRNVQNALMAALAYLKKDMDILHREEMESEVMRVLSRNGMIDMTGSLLPGVDGFDTRMNVGIVSMMRQCTAYAVRYSHNSDHWFGPVLAKKFFEQA